MTWKLKYKSDHNDREYRLIHFPRQTPLPYRAKYVNLQLNKVEMRQTVT